MLRSLLIMGVLLLSTPVLRACDACGCSILFMDMGLTPRYETHQFGLRWQQQRFRSFATPEDQAAGIIGSREYFRQLDVQARIVLYPRWRLLVQVPYTWLQRELGEVTSKQAGFNDPSVLLQWEVLSNEAAGRKGLRHRLNVGAGLKMPLGPGNTVDDEQPAQNPNFRLGSGSWDAVFFGQYVLRHGRWGAAADALLSLNGTNDEDYRFGHRLNSHVQLFGVFPSGKLGWMPSVGTYFEAAARDVQRDFYREDTGGHYWFGQAGLQVFLPAVSLGVQYQWPLAHQWADGLVEARPRWSVQSSLYF